MKKIIGASLGEDVHIQGVYNFLKLAEEKGYNTNFLGPAVNIDRLINTIKEQNPDIVALSYRLTPETGDNLIKELDKRIKQEGLTQPEYVFGGTEPVTQVAKKYNLFSFISNGNNNKDLMDFLNNEKQSYNQSTYYPQDIINRINQKKPYPVLRTHFGQPNLEDTIKGVEKIADSGLIDVVSLGIDQDAQANFFHPEKQDIKRAGAGGVPIRTESDLKKLYTATRRGNFPLMRSYAGTDDLIRMAEMYTNTINNAWAAIPIFWFNDMDGRGPQELEHSIDQHLNTIEWHALEDTPVEILEAHHWGMRWAHDSLTVASAYLGAKIAKEIGVDNYIHQYMFNVPSDTSFKNDLSKMLAIKEMLTELEEEYVFDIYHQTRAGLPSFPSNMESARGQLASSTLLQMQLNPDIIHIVNYSEPHHAATAEDVINSAYITNQVIKNSFGMPDMAKDPEIVKRKEQIKKEARYLVDFIEKNGNILDPKYLISIVKDGIFDAPMLKNNRYAQGNLEVVEKDGAYFPAKDRRIISEKERLNNLMNEKTRGLNLYANSISNSSKY